MKRSLKRAYSLNTALMCSLLVLLFALPGLASEPEILKSDDWRYRALAELAKNNVLDIKDSPYYLTKIPINKDFAAASIERALLKLGLTDLDLTNVAAIDIAIMGTTAQKITSRDAWLLNDLVKEFSVQLMARGVVGKRQSAEAPSGIDYSYLMPSGGANVPVQTGTSVLSLTEVLEKINMPSAVSQASLTMPDKELLPGSIVPKMQPLQLDTINPEKSKQVSLFEVLNVSASLFADEKREQNKSSAGVGLLLGNSQGGGLTLDYRMTGSHGEDSAITDLTAKTGVGIKYRIDSIVPLRSVTDSLTIQAGYNIESGDLKTAADKGLELQSSASLGIFYKLLLGESAFMQAGYQVEQVRNIIASDALSTKSWLYDDSSPLSWLFRGSLRLNSDVGVKQLAGIDLGYRIFNNASIMVGYRLIDFSDFDKIDLKKNLTALGISIKF